MFWLVTDWKCFALLTCGCACLVCHQASKQQQWQVLDEEGEDLSEFLLGSTAAAASPGCKRAAVDSGYISSSEEEDQIAADTGPNAGVQEGAAAAQSEAPKRPQIIFCSRTHSQLSQFVGELHRTRYAESTLLVAVGSRRSLCVNDAVGGGPADSTAACRTRSCGTGPTYIC